jgi:hypothetical protein
MRDILGDRCQVIETRCRCPLSFFFFAPALIARPPRKWTLIQCNRVVLEGMNAAQVLALNTCPLPMATGLVSLDALSTSFVQC